MVADRVEVVSRKAAEEHAWRWTSDGKTGFEIEPAERAAAGHHGHSLPERRRQRILQQLETARNHQEIFQPHRVSDLSHRRQERVGREGKEVHQETHHRTNQFRQRDVEAPQERTEGRRLQRALQDDLGRLGRSAVLVPHEGGRNHGIHHAVLCSVEGADGSLSGGLQAGREALCQAGLHHGRFEGAAADVPALPARHHRQRRSAAQCQPRDSAAEQDSQRDPDREREEGAFRAQVHRRPTSRSST